MRRIERPCRRSMTKANVNSLLQICNPQYKGVVSMFHHARSPIPKHVTFRVSWLRFHRVSYRSEWRDHQRRGSSYAEPATPHSPTSQAVIKSTRPANIEFHCKRISIDIVRATRQHRKRWSMFNTPHRNCPIEFKTLKNREAFPNNQG